MPPARFRRRPWRRAFGKALSRRFNTRQLPAALPVDRTLKRLTLGSPVRIFACGAADADLHSCEVVALSPRHCCGEALFFYAEFSMLFRGALGGGAASGKLGALVASHNSGGQYLRSRVTPTNTNTLFQQEVRNAIRTLSPQYATSLTDAERLGWEVYAENVTRRNRLGDSIKISGISTFVAFNTPRIQNGQTIITAAPTTFDLGDAGTPGTITVGANSSNGTLTYSATDDWVTGGSLNSLYLYASRPQNNGKSFFAGPYRLATRVAGGGTTGLAAFTLPFPAGGTLTQRFFFNYRIGRSDGRLSSPVQLTAQPT